MKREKAIPAIKPVTNKPKKPTTFTAPGSPYGNPPSRGEEVGRMQVCPNCSGQGYRRENNVKIPCGLCRGNGRVMNPNSGK